MTSSLLSVYVSVLRKSYPDASTAQVERAAKALIDQKQIDGAAAEKMGKELDALLSPSADAHQPAEHGAHGSRRGNVRSRRRA